MTEVTRAFAIYFNLANLLEELHAHRTRRRLAADGDPRWLGSFNRTLCRPGRRGVSLDDALGQLDRTVVHSGIHRASHRGQAACGAGCAAANVRMVSRAHLRQSGRAQRKPKSRSISARTSRCSGRPRNCAAPGPTVEDEIRNGLYYFRASLFSSVPQIYRNLEQAIENDYGERVEAPDCADVRLLDRRRPRRQPLRHRPRDPLCAAPAGARDPVANICSRIDELSSRLAFSARWCNPSEAFWPALEADEQLIAAHTGTRPERYAAEPYRRKLYLMRRRIARHGRPDPDRVASARRAQRAAAAGLRRADELLDDIRIMRESLIGHGDEAIANDRLKDWQRLVETFGFHLARLDLREESTRHTQCVEELMRALKIETDYAVAGRSGAASRFSMRELARDHTPALGRLDISSEVARYAGKPGGGARVHAYPRQRGVRQLCDLDDAQRLRRAGAGVADARDRRLRAGRRRSQPPLAIAPLFETVADLEHIEPVLDTLLATSGLPRFRRRQARPTASCVRKSCSATPIPARTAAS